MLERCPRCRRKFLEPGRQLCRRCWGQLTGWKDEEARKKKARQSPAPDGAGGSDGEVHHMVFNVCTDTGQDQMDLHRLVALAERTRQLPDAWGVTVDVPVLVLTLAQDDGSLRQITVSDLPEVIRIKRLLGALRRPQRAA